MCSQGSWLAFASVALASLLAVAGCDDGVECVIDSDCADFSQVCVAQRCVAPGAIDAGRMDSGAPPRDSGPDEVDSGTPDSGGSTSADGGDEVGEGGVDGGGPTCADVTGTWIISDVIIEPCGSAADGYGLSIAAGAAACEFTATSGAPDMPAIDGTFTLDGTNVSGDALMPGGAAATSCTGSLSGDTLTFACNGGACVMQLARPTR